MIVTKYPKDWRSKNKDYEEIEYHDEMKELLKIKSEIVKKYQYELAIIDNKIKDKCSDHTHRYIETGDSPPYDYEYTCKVCGYIYVK